MEHPTALQLALRSVEKPIMDFIQTGLFNDDWSALPEEARIARACVSIAQTRRIARRVAKELKRPFIVSSEFISRNYWCGAARRWLESDEPRWRSAYIEMPKRKYLMPMVTPLLLVADANNAPVVRYQRGENSSLWRFEFKNRDFWLEYRAALDRPEMRAARKLPRLE